MIRYEALTSDFEAALIGQRFVDEELTVKDILLVTDRHPRSLLAISYALFFARNWNASMIIVSVGVHDRLISKECADLQIKIREVVVRPDPEIDIIEALNTKYTIDLIVIPFHHKLVGPILTHIHLPVVIAKIPRHWLKSELEAQHAKE